MDNSDTSSKSYGNNVDSGPIIGSTSNNNGSSKIFGISVRAYALIIVLLVSSACVIIKTEVPTWYVALVSGISSFYFGKISATDKH